VEVSTNAIYYGGCEPRQITFQVGVSDPDMHSIILFTRVEDKATGEQTDWGAGVFDMEQLGSGWFSLSLLVTEIPDFNKYEDALLLYQLVTTDEDDAILGRTQTFRDVSLGKCGVAPPPPAQPRETGTPTPDPRATPTR